MTEKKKSAAEATEKVMTKYDKKVQRRKEEAEKEKKRKIRSRIITVVVAVLLVAFIAYFPIRRYIANNGTYIKVGDHKVNEIEFNYYYNSSLNQFINENGVMVYFMGFDPDGDLSEQQYSEYMTYDEYFQYQAMSALLEERTLVKQGENTGFEYNTDEDYQEFVTSLKAAAASYGVTLKTYVEKMYGRFATLSNLEQILRDSFYAAEYYEHLAASIEPTDDEINEYYELYKANYDSVDFKMISVAAEIPEGESTKDAEGNTVIADPTEEQIAEAMEAAKEEAEDKLKVIDSEGSLNENVKAAYASTLYADWLFDSARKAGDTTVVADETNHMYYVLQFEDRYLDETKAVNVRVIMTTTDKNETIMDEWKSTGANENAFALLAEKYSEDTYSNENGGLYEDLAASTISSELAEWMTDEARQPGDVTTIAATDGNFYALYYVGEGRPEWMASIESTLRSGSMETFITSLISQNEVVDEKNRLTYDEAIAAEQAAQTAE